MPTVYPEAKEALGLEFIHMVIDAISLQAYEGDAVYDATDVFIADVVGTQVGPAVEFTGRDFTAGQFTATDPVTVNWPNGFTVEVLLVFQDTGNPATSRVIAWIDTKGDSTPISIPTTGAPLNLHWNDPIVSIGGA